MKICPTCREPNDTKQSYCRECFNAYKRETRKPYHELTPEERHKQRTRAKTRRLIRKGDLVKGPCAVDGCKGGPIEPHHTDYDDAHNVVWLCRMHHRWFHRAGVSLKTFLNFAKEKLAGEAA